MERQLKKEGRINSRWEEKNVRRQGKKVVRKAGVICGGTEVRKTAGQKREKQD